jgi:hypothetical protein
MGLFSHFTANSRLSPSMVDRALAQLMFAHFNEGSVTKTQVKQTADTPRSLTVYTHSIADQLRVNLFPVTTDADDHRELAQYGPIDLSSARGDDTPVADGGAAAPLTPGALFTGTSINIRPIALNRDGREHFVVQIEILEDKLTKKVLHIDPKSKAFTDLFGYHPKKHGVLDRTLWGGWSIEQKNLETVYTGDQAASDDTICGYWVCAYIKGILAQADQYSITGQLADPKTVAKEHPNDDALETFVFGLLNTAEKNPDIEMPTGPDGTADSSEDDFDMDGGADPADIDTDDARDTAARDQAFAQLDTQLRRYGHILNSNNDILPYQSKLPRIGNSDDISNEIAKITTAQETLHHNRLGSWRALLPWKFKRASLEKKLAGILKRAEKEWIKAKTEKLLPAATPAGGHSDTDKKVACLKANIFRFRAVFEAYQPELPDLGIDAYRPTSSGNELVEEIKWISTVQQSLKQNRLDWFKSLWPGNWKRHQLENDVKLMLSDLKHEWLAVQKVVSAEKRYDNRNWTADLDVSSEKTALGPAPDKAANPKGHSHYQKMMAKLNRLEYYQSDKQKDKRNYERYQLKGQLAGDHARLIMLREKAAVKQGTAVPIAAPAATSPMPH